MTENEGTRTGTTLGPYAIGRLLGRGGMGEVYRAHDERRDRDVALKVLHASLAEDPDFRGRFIRESQTVARLADPHVIPIHDFGEIDGVLYIDMRLVEGQNLAEALRGGPLPPARAVTLVEQVAGALDAAHAQGLVHRDVKPANVELTTTGFPYLLDFGLAVTDNEPRMTSAGMFVGSQAYAAPERFEGDAATAAGDVYSLACLLYELLTGHPPFRGASLGEMLKQHLTAPPPRPSTESAVSAAMDAVIARGMAKNPRDRYPSCGALAAAARGAIDDESGSTYSDTVIRSTSDPSMPTSEASRTPYPTLPVPQVSRPPATGMSNPSYPYAPPPAPPARRRSLLPVLAAVAVVLAAVTALLTYSIWEKTVSHPVTVANSAPATVTTTNGTTVVTVNTSTVTVTPTPTTVAADPAAALEARAAADKPFVLANLNNQWVAQLSTKYPGLYADGRTWDDDAIMAEVTALGQRFGDVRLLYTGDWPVFDQTTDWVTVTAQTFTTADDAITWCQAQGFDGDHCLAKFISNTAGPDGTTKTY